MTGGTDNNGKKRPLGIGHTIINGVEFTNIQNEEVLPLLEKYYNNTDATASREIYIDFITQDLGAPWSLGKYINQNRELIVQLIEALRTGRGFPENVPEDFFLYVSQIQFMSGFVP
jgi:hypothetical protein